MKIVYKVIKKTNDFEQIIVEDDFDVKEPYTEIPPPQPCWKPVFDFKKNQWTDAATEEDTQTPISELTEFEKLVQTVSDLEIKDLEKEALIEQLGQQVTDLEIQLMEGE